MMMFIIIVIRNEEERCWPTLEADSLAPTDAKGALELEFRFDQLKAGSR
jgi:hypothetical protein